MSKKICKCGEEMKQNIITNYTVIYCEAIYKDAKECFEKNDCWACGDYYNLGSSDCCADVRARHTRGEATGPRW
mgnify:CR=1 FL=1|tara:strand:+ start:6804 stop:7025 length:222 start_codon:yes stop_codon:yes gene_type:complete